MISHHPLSIFRTTSSKEYIAHNLNRQKVKKVLNLEVGGGGGELGVTLVPVCESVF